MEAQKILEVIAVYRKRFLEQGISIVDFPHTSNPGSKGEILAHCHGMLDRMEGFIKEGRMEKTFRWLGFIQGCLWSTGEYTLEDLQNHNRPDVKEPETNPHYWGGWHFVAEGHELYRCVLKIFRQQQGKPVPLDEFLADEGVLSCYTPNHFMRLCNPPNVRRARQAIRGAIGYLRRKGHIIESTTEFGQIAYSWQGK